MDMGDRSRPFNDRRWLGLADFSNPTNKLCFFWFLCLYLFLYGCFFLSLYLFLFWYLFLCHGSFLLFHFKPCSKAEGTGLPALSENANGHMGTYTCMGDPKGLFTILRDLKTLPILGFFFPPLLPDLGIAMKFIVLLL